MISNSGEKDGTTDRFILSIHKIVILLCAKLIIKMNKNINLETKVRCSAYMSYTASRLAQIHFVCLYAVSLLIAYAFRQTNMVSIYNTSFWIAPLVFVVAYTYMQTDKIGSKFLVPKKLYIPFRFLVFAIMLTTISNSAFMCVLLSLLALLLFVSTVISNSSTLKPLSIILFPALFTYTVYVCLLIYYGAGSLFDYIAGFFILLSIAVKTSLLAFSERISKLFDMPNVESDTKFMEGEGAEELEEDIEQIKHSSKKITKADAFISGMRFGCVIFFSNASALFKNVIKVNIR